MNNGDMLRLMNNKDLAYEIFQICARLENENFFYGVKDVEKYLNKEVDKGD